MSARERRTDTQRAGAHRYALRARGRRRKSSPLAGARENALARARGARMGQMRAVPGGGYDTRSVKGKARDPCAVCGVRGRRPAMCQPRTHTHTHTHTQARTPFLSLSPSHTHTQRMKL